MSENTFFGMSGHYAVLSMLLRRGYNVAVPAVDVGDDAIVINDGSHDLRRLQIKSGNPRKAAGGAVEVVFKLSRKQLRDPLGAPLYYMLMAWIEDRWSFIIIPRDALDFRQRKREDAWFEYRPGRRGGEVPGDALKVTVNFRRDPRTGDEDAVLWGESLRDYLNRWTPSWPALLPDRASPAPSPSARP